MAWRGAASCCLAHSGFWACAARSRFTVPDWCGGVRPCPPPCLGAPEVAREPQEFVQLRPLSNCDGAASHASYRWTPPRVAAPIAPCAPHRRVAPCAAVVELPPANLTMPALPDPKNVYSEIARGQDQPRDRRRVGARLCAQPDAPAASTSSTPRRSRSSTAISRVPSPQHIVPSWDLQTLWVSGDISYTGGHASVAPIDPKTGKVGKPISVPDSYNMYFTPDGRSAIVVAEAKRRLEFRDPHTMALQTYIVAPECAGINHADFSLDGAYAIFTCEFSDKLAKIDLVHHKLEAMLQLSPKHIPQDIRVAPDGSAYYVADMLQDGLIVIDGDKFVETGFIKTGVGTHGLYPSRDGKKLYISNRGTHNLGGRAEGRGQRVGDGFRDAQNRSDLDDSRRRQPGHGQCQRRRQISLALRALRRRGLRFQHRRRLGEDDSRRRHAARADGVAAAGAVLAGAYGEFAVEAGKAGQSSGGQPSASEMNFRTTTLGFARALSARKRDSPKKVRV